MCDCLTTEICESVHNRVPWRLLRKFCPGGLTTFAFTFLVSLPFPFSVRLKPLFLSFPFLLS